MSKHWETDQIDRTVTMLNEMVSLDPRTWALFDVMIPCAPVVGHVSAIELMGIHQKLAMVGVLGIVNGVLGDPASRISIVTENKDGNLQRRFARTSIAALAQHYGHEGADASPAPGQGSPGIET